jgi:hypothetical protein
VHVRGRRQKTKTKADRSALFPEARLTPELAAALEEKPVHPAREFVRLLGKDGVLAPAVLLTRARPVICGNYHRSHGLPGFVSLEP